MRATVSLGIYALLLLCAGAVLGQGLPLQARVERAVSRDLGIRVKDPNPTFALQFLASEVRVPEHASLRVAAMHSAGGRGTWLLRMECGSLRECLPFEVVLRGRKPLAEAVEGTHPTTASIVPPSRVDVGVPLVRAGQRVQLAESISGMHLSVPAVCLQGGSLGQRIRVRNVASRKVVLARVRAVGQVVVED